MSHASSNSSSPTCPNTLLARCFEWTAVCNCMPDNGSQIKRKIGGFCSTGEQRQLIHHRIYLASRAVSPENHGGPPDWLEHAQSTSDCRQLTYAVHCNCMKVG